MINISIDAAKRILWALNGVESYKDWSLNHIKMSIEISQIDTFVIPLATKWIKEWVMHHWQKDEFRKIRDKYRANEWVQNDHMAQLDCVREMCFPLSDIKQIDGKWTLDKPIIYLSTKDSVDLFEYLNTKEPFEKIE